MQVDPFIFHYHNEVEKSEDSMYKYLTHKEVVYKTRKDSEYYSFTDEQGDEWLCCLGIIAINFARLDPGYTYCLADGTKLIRVENPQEVIERVIRYFGRFIVNEAEIKPPPTVEIKKEDRFFNLN